MINAGVVDMLLGVRMVGRHAKPLRAVACVLGSRVIYDRPSPGAPVR
jgi:hypothetical protein